MNAPPKTPLGVWRWPVADNGRALDADGAPETNSRELNRLNAALESFVAATFKPLPAMQQALTYFQHLPGWGEGWINVHRKGGSLNGAPGNAHRTPQTAASDALHWASKGFDVYAAQGVFKDAWPKKDRLPYRGAKRKKDNLLGCAMLYMDVDVKKGAHADTSEAATALLAFVRAIEWPPSMVVASGTGGLHAYWPLGGLVSVEQFRLRAAALFKLASEASPKLCFDPGCTSNPVCLLRMPGTLNFKQSEDGEHDLPVTLVYAE